jgi:hypothetical protein
MTWVCSSTTVRAEATTPVTSLKAARPARGEAMAEPAERAATAKVVNCILAVLVK